MPLQAGGFVGSLSTAIWRVDRYDQDVGDAGRCLILEGNLLREWGLWISLICARAVFSGRCFK